MSLPTDAKIITSSRDYQIFDLPLPTEPPTANRIAVLWDADRDERVLDIVTALHYRDLRVRAHVLALSETYGVVTVWFGTGQYLQKCHEVIQAACDAALRPHDRWKVDPLQVVDMMNGRVNVDELPPNSPIAHVARVWTLGLVKA